MRMRQLLCGAVIAGVATMGTAGIAYADPTPPSGNPQAGTPVRHRGHEDRCERARKLLPKLEDRRERTQRRIDELKKDIEQARDHHREDVVERLERELDKVQREHDRVVDLINKIHQRCGEDH